MTLLKGFWNFLVGVKDALALLFLLTILIVLLGARQQGAALSVPAGGALVVAPQGFLVDQAKAPELLSLIGGGPEMPGEIAARDVIRAIDAAADDKKVAALVLDLDGFWGGGLANLQSAADAIARFRAKGKKVYAFGSFYLDDSYFLAAQADEVWLSPLGAVLLTGPGSSGLYFKNALDKLAVNVNVFRVGTFKSAVEPYILDSASPEARAANQALVDNLWESWTSIVSARRKGADINRYISDLPRYLAAANGDFAQAALKVGLVDRVGTRSAFEEAMAERLGDGDFGLAAAYKGIGFSDYAKSRRSALPASGDAVGVVYVAGDLIDGEAPAGTAGGQTVSDLIYEALENDSIKSLVVRIDSPGGSVTASEQIREALLVAKSRGIPVVASFGPVAASGGYWVATAADEIFAQPTTITGSIGVFAVVPTFERSLEKLGINADPVRSTPLSGAPDVLDGLTPEVETLMQASVEDIYRRFLRIVSDARRLPVDRVNEIAQGRVWPGGTAHQLKLVDHLGGLDAAVAAAAKRAGLATKSMRTVDIEVAPPFPVQLLNDMFGSDSGEAAPPADAVSRMVRAGQYRAMAALDAALGVAEGPAMQVRCIACVGAVPAAPDARARPRWLEWLAK
jgi:protease-4